MRLRRYVVVLLVFTTGCAWWQIDPRTGETVAVTDEGLHQANVAAVVTRREGGSIHAEFYINGRHMPYQAKDFANGPCAREFFRGLHMELASRIILTITRWTSVL